VPAGKPKLIHLQGLGIIQCVETRMDVIDAAIQPLIKPVNVYATRLD
jgi:hypothetical protein